MANFHTDCILNRQTGIPKDNVVMGFNFTTGDAAAPTNGHITTIENGLSDFFNDLADGQDNTLSQYLSGVIGPRGVGLFHTMKTWAITSLSKTAPEGSPNKTTSFAIPDVAAASPYPAQVNAVCQLMAAGWELQPVEAEDDADADLSEERPRSRYFGEVNFGPLNGNAFNTLDFEAVLGTAFRTNYAAAVVGLDDFVRGSGLRLAVWSHTDAIMRPISHVKINNKPDTLKGRLTRSTASTMAAVAP